MPNNDLLHETPLPSFRPLFRGRVDFGLHWGPWAPQRALMYQYENVIA